MPSVPAPSTPTRYAERLTPAWWVWLSALGFALSFGIVLIRVDLTAAAVGAVLVAAASLWGLARTTVPVAVEDGTFVAGRARLPVEVVADVEPLDAEAMSRARGVELDARSYLCLRGWISGGVRIRLDDPDDDTPAWIVSSREPAVLAAALAAARDARRG